MTVKQISPQQLRAQLDDGAELALIDVRPQGAFSTSHLLLASCIALDQLELRIADLVPRRDTRIVLCDEGGSDDAQRAAVKLSCFGYRDVALLHGGTRAWREAGYELFSGVNVLSKAFGEYIEQRYHTPHLSAQELQARQAAGEKLLILDSRPMQEFQRMSIPGGIDCPGAELVYRAFGVVPDATTTVVVNCAGRTRSIIGAQSLINAGLPNPVLALENGTMGWTLAGLILARGCDAHAAAPSAAALSQARQAAARVAARFQLRSIDHAELAAMRGDTARTTYLLDVRTREEFEAGHLPGSRHAPGGQLVQATDEYVATRNARIVLIDAEGVRACMSASWLVQMGWRDVFILRDALETVALEAGSRTATLLDFPAGVSTLTPAQLAQALQRKIVVDLGSSLDYREAHVAGAYWCTRQRLPQLVATLGAPELVLTSPNDVLARYAAQDLLRDGHLAQVLEGGTQAWRASGLPIESGAQRLFGVTDDIWYKPYDHASDVEQAMRDYLSWEVKLSEQLARDGSARFL